MHGLRHSCAKQLFTLIIVVCIALPLISSLGNVKASATPQITLSPNSGTYDTSISINGTNFRQNAKVTIKWSSLSYWSLTIYTDSNGAFTTTFNVPDGASIGNCFVTAVDDVGNSAQAPFTLDSVYVKTGFFGIRTPKQNVQFSYFSSGFYCNTWQVYYDGYGSWANVMSSNYGVYVLRFTYANVTYVFDLAGGMYNNYPVSLVEKVVGFSIINFNHIQGNVFVCDPSGATVLLNIFVDIYTPQTQESYYSVIFNIIAGTRINDLTLYSAYNLNAVTSTPNYAYYEEANDAVYQEYEPLPSNPSIPGQDAYFAGFGSVVPVSTHHDAVTNCAEIQRIAINLRDFDFNYRDRDEANGDPTGDSGVGLQWALSPMNPNDTISLPIVFASSEGTLENFNTALAQSKTFAYQLFPSKKPSIAPNTTQGPGSSIVNVKGQNFMPLSAVTLRFGSLSMASYPTDNTGSFQGSFAVPTSVTGTYSITAADEYGLTATSNFTVVELTLQWLLNNINQYDASITGLINYVNGTLLAVINTNNGNILAKLSDVNATLAQLVSDGNTLAAQINTALGTITTQAAQINATIVGVVKNANDTLSAKIDTSLGTTTAALSLLNATIAGVVKNANDTLSAKIDTSLGTITLSLNALNATITAVNGTVATINTSLGTLKTNVSNLNAQITALNGTTATIKTDLGTLQGNVTAFQGDIVKIETKMGIIEAPVSTSNTSFPLQPLILIEIAAISAIVVTAVILNRGTQDMLAKLKHFPKITSRKLSKDETKEQEEFLEDIP
jgi:hypothetical protein